MNKEKFVRFMIDLASGFDKTRQQAKTKKEKGLYEGALSVLNLMYTITIQGEFDNVELEKEKQKKIK